MNIIIFGPNGSGKGTQGALIQRRYGIPHIETGVIFRKNIEKKTELGVRAQEFVRRGELVPDEVTIPMLLARLKEDDGRSGWLLDGFPRNLTQAEALWEALNKEKIPLDLVIEIVLDRDTAKKRIMGRRLCPQDNNHPNNIFIEAIAPTVKDGRYVCRVCGSEDLLSRPDDQDTEAIDKRHGIYYDRVKGTLAAVDYLRGKTRVISVDGQGDVAGVSESILKGIG